MDDKSLFLQHFTRNKAISISSKSKRPDSIFFMICFNEQGLAFLKVVDKNGEEVETEYRLYTDNNFNVLRSMARAKEDMQEKITWGTEQKRVYLHEYRWLLYELMRCDNIVDEKMRKVSVSEETLQVRLVIEKTGNGQCSTHIDVVGESSDQQQFMFLSDSHVLTSNTIHPIHPNQKNPYLRHLFSSFPPFVQYSFGCPVLLIKTFVKYLFPPRNPCYICNVKRRKK